MRGMKRALRAALLLFGTLVGLGTGSMVSAQTCATTQDPRICVTVSGPASVTKSTSTTPTFWAVNLSIHNGAANVLNRVQITGSLFYSDQNVPVFFVDPATGLAPANPSVYLTTTNPAISCSVSNGTSLSCGSDGTASIPPGQTLAFTVMSNVPTTTGAISLSWAASFAEGNSTSGNSNTGTASGTLTTQVTEPSPDSAAASFPATGGTLATLTGGTLNTKIVVPPTDKTTNATITQSTIVGDPRCTNFRTCYKSDVSIPDFVVTEGSDPLKVELFMAASNVLKGVRIDQVQILYTGTLFDGSQVTDERVYPCAALDVPRDDGMPCINRMVNYKNKSSAPTWRDAIGFGFYLQLINKKNGGFGLF